MSGYLVPISKAKKQGKGTQAENQRTVRDAGKPKPAAPMPPPAPPSPVPPGTPYNKISERTMRFANPKLLIGGTAALGAAGTGAYLYRRRRVEKSLSSMQRDFPSVMMRTP
jgi:hypothetical protein